MPKIFYFVFILLLLPLVAKGASPNIDINTAPLEDLIKIIHIGEERAKELISLRPFSSLDDLIRIKGIGEKRVEDIKKQGLAWVGSQEKSEPETSPELGVKKAEIGSLRAEVVNYPAGIVFNEILPSPEGPDETEEWTVSTIQPILSAYL